MDSIKLERISKRKSVRIQLCLSTDRAISQLKMKLIFFVTLGVILNNFSVTSDTVDLAKEFEEAS